MVLVCFAAGVTSWCDGVLSVHGRVASETGNPIAGARVSAYNVSPETSATTDAQGCFRLFKVTRPFEHQVPFLVQAPGYQTFLGEITCPKDERVTVRMASDQNARSVIDKGTVDPTCDRRGHIGAGLDRIERDSRDPFGGHRALTGWPPEASDQSLAELRADVGRRCDLSRTLSTCVPARSPHARQLLRGLACRR